MHFTCREREVLRLLSQGLANKTIALRLGISPHTVRDHICTMLLRTGCATWTPVSQLWVAPTPCKCRATDLVPHL